MKRIIVLLMFIFIISFGISTPAHFLYSLVDDQLQGAELTNIEGSIWQGEADLSVGNMDTGKVTWRFSPTALLTGGLGWNFTLINESVTGFAAAKVWSLSTLSSLAINTNTQHLAQWNPLLNTISSDVSAQLEQVSANQCRQTQGTMTLENTSVMGLPFGIIDVQVTCEGENYSASFRNQESPIQLTGSALLTPKGGYQFNAQLLSRDPALRQQLSGLLGGSPEDQRFTVRERGNL